MPIIQKDISLKQYSSYTIGGPARFFAEVENENDLREAVVFARENHLQIFVLGGGSNLIISDQGFDGLVIKIINYQLSIINSLVSAGAGIPMAELVAQTTGKGLAGLEWAGGLPGSLGGALFGNAGCFGSEIKDAVASVQAVELKIKNLPFGQNLVPRLARNKNLLSAKGGVLRRQTLKTYAPSECGFSYRSSMFKREGDYVIFSATLKLHSGDREKLQQAAQEKMAYREERHPLEYPNIGSIFKNIDDPERVKEIVKRFPEIADKVATAWHGKVPTAVLVEKAGLQGKQIGGAQVSEKHANFIINKEHASAIDVLNLINLIKRTIHDMFGIDLVEEVRYVGFD